MGKQACSQIGGYACSYKGRWDLALQRVCLQLQMVDFGLFCRCLSKWWFFYYYPPQRGSDLRAECTLPQQKTSCECFLQEVAWRQKSVGLAGDNPLCRVPNIQWMFGTRGKRLLRGGQDRGWGEVWTSICKCLHKPLPPSAPSPSFGEGSLSGLTLSCRISVNPHPNLYNSFHSFTNSTLPRWGG